MTDAEFWEVERELWLGGPEAFRAWVAAECLMVFPEPAGILTGPATSRGWRPRRAGAGRLRAPLVRRTGYEAAVLAYRAEATRPAAPRRALCARAMCGRPATGGWCSTSRRPSEQEACHAHPALVPDRSRW